MAPFPQPASGTHSPTLVAMDMIKQQLPRPKHWELARRYVSVVAGMALMVCVGSNHAVSAWNSQLKQELSYSQAEISLVCSMASFGAYFSVTPGWVFDHIGAHRSVLLGGAVLSAIYASLSYGILTIPLRMHALAVGLAFVLIGQAGNFGVFASLGPNEGLFGDANRGKIMALQLASFSAGGALFAVAYHRSFDENVAGYFKFMAVLLLVVFLLSWLTLYRKRANETDPAMHEQTALEEFMPSELDETTALVPHASVDITGRELMADSRFWLLFTTVFILVGSSLFVMANISFIVESLDGPMDQVPIMVVLFSVGNCSGRLIGGIVSDHVLARCPRIYFISLSCVLVAAIHTMFLTIPAAYLALPVTLAGIADGTMFAAFPVLTRETFGAQHFGKNFGMMSVANAIGFPLFFNPLGSFFYSRESVLVDGVEKCSGAHCFAPVFILVVALSLVALAASLRFASRHHYAVLP